MWRAFFIATMITLCSTVAFAQGAQTPPATTDREQSITNRHITELPVSRGFKPKLALQQALKIAEKFIKREKMDLSTFYLFEAKWILYGTESKEARWYFWWVNVDGALGHYVQITISMEGKAQLLGSM